MIRRAAYRTLLAILLPAGVRTRFGADMAGVFEGLSAQARRDVGLLGLAILWMRETIGMARFGLRARFASWRASPRGPEWRTEIGWAWRGIRGRRWSAPFIVALLGVTLTATAVTFAVVDAVLLHPYPFPDVDRIVTIADRASGGPLTRAQSPLIYDAWRAEKETFSAVGTFLNKNVFVRDSAGLTRVVTADITVDLPAVLGVQPKWGRGFSDDDLRDTSVFAALVSEDFASDRFGNPARAVGQRLDATGAPLQIVGVMPAEFAFPSKRVQIWRALDLRGALTENFGRPQLIGRIAPGLASDAAVSQVAAKAGAVGNRAGVIGYSATIKPRFEIAPADTIRTLLLVLLGAALCFLLAASANIASLELAHSADRAQARAVRLSLGASRASLVRVAALEGVFLFSGALIVALVLGGLIASGLSAYLPANIAFGGLHHISVDRRVILVAVAAAGLAWTIASLLPVLVTTRNSPGVALARGGRSQAGSRRGLRLRGLLTTIEVALGVMLVVGGLLYARTYLALLSVEKGFDSAGLVVASVDMPASYFSGSNTRAAFQQRVVEELKTQPGVAAVTTSGPPPNTGDSPSQSSLIVDGAPLAEAPLLIGRKSVDDDFFDVIKLRLLRGRRLNATDGPTDIVVPESFARRLVPGGDAVGHTISGVGGPGFRPPDVLTIRGVVGDARTDPTRMPAPSDARWYFYDRVRPRPAGVPVSTAQSFDNGGSYSVVTVTVRLDSPSRAPAIENAFRRVDPSLTPVVTFVDDTYAEQNAATLLAARLVGGFSGLAWIIAMVGLYGVISYFVVTRTREIGIRMALGAERRHIRREILATSSVLVLTGLVIGATAAWLIARALQAQLFGVSPADPVTFLTVAASVALTALVATWRPAERAAGTNPATTLRSD